MSWIAIPCVVPTPDGKFYIPEDVLLWVGPSTPVALSVITRARLEATRDHRRLANSGIRTRVSYGNDDVFYSILELHEVRALFDGARES